MILPAMEVLPGCCDCAQHDGQEDMLTAPDPPPQPSPWGGRGRSVLFPPPKGGRVRVGGKNNKTGLRDYARNDAIVFTLLLCMYAYSDPACFYSVMLRAVAASRPE